MRLLSERSVRCIVTVLLAAAAACGGDAKTGNGGAAGGAGVIPNGAPSQDSLFVTRTPASSVPVKVQAPPPPPPPAAPAATNTGAGPGGAAPGGAPGGAIPAGTGNPGAAQPGTPGAPGAPGAPAAPAMMDKIPLATGGMPMLPEIMGDCPEFVTGTTIMVAGHKGVNVQAAAAGGMGPIVFYWAGTR